MKPNRIFRSVWGGILVGIVCLCLPSWASSLQQEKMIEAVSAQEILQMGERLYNTAGANTCLMCHGRNGGGGAIAEATNLNEPRNWKIYKALGGDASFQKDAVKLREEMEGVHLALIQYGSLRWNQERKQFHPQIQLDFSQTENAKGILNPLMYGIQQAPTLHSIKRIRSEFKKEKNLIYNQEEMEWLAAYAIYQYIKTFDQGGSKGGVFVSKAK